MCRAICGEFGIPYVAFLQPIMGIGNYQLNAEEIEYHEGYLKEHPGLHGVPYHEAARTFYEEARKYVAQHPDFMVDLVDVFQGHQGVFADSRHPNERGYRILAEAIFENLRSRNCI
jgi:lysophospholipase L1-like esterase